MINISGKSFDIFGIDRVAHLPDDERGQLFSLLDKYESVFATRHGFCSLVGY